MREAALLACGSIVSGQYSSGGGFRQVDAAGLNQRVLAQQVLPGVKDLIEVMAEICIKLKQCFLRVTCHFCHACKDASNQRGFTEPDPDGQSSCKAALVNSRQSKLPYNWISPLNMPAVRGRAAPTLVSPKGDMLVVQVVGSCPMKFFQPHQALCLATAFSTKASWVCAT